WLLNEEERATESMAGFDEVERLYNQYVDSVPASDPHRRHADRLRALARVSKAAIPVESVHGVYSMVFFDAMKKFLTAIEEFVAYENDPTFAVSYKQFKEGVEALMASHLPDVSRDEKYRKLDFAIESLSRSKDRLAEVDRTNQLY